MKRLTRLLSESGRQRGFIRRGRFTLKSGIVSDTYIDIKAATGDPELLALMARGLARLVPRTATCIAGTGYGGLPLAAAVALRLKKPLVMVRDVAKGHGRKTNIDGFVPGTRDRVAIVDDVFTSGTSMRHVERVIGRTGARIAARCVVVDRSGGSLRHVRSLVLFADLIRAVRRHPAT